VKPHLLPRLARALAATCSFTLLIGASVSLAAPPAGATTLIAAVLSPIDNASITSSPEEPHHTPFDGDYSFDVAGGRQTVYARFRSNSGAVGLTVASIGRACASQNFADGGDRIALRVSIGGTTVGTVTYAHITAPRFRVGDSVPVGAAIADMATAADGLRSSSCWTGSHIHVEPRNDVRFGCYVGGLRGTSVGATTALGSIGGELATGRNQRCPNGWEGGTPGLPTAAVSSGGGTLRAAATTQSSALAAIPGGTQLTLECWRRGEAVRVTTGAYDLWHLVVFNGARGYVADAVMNTPAFPNPAANQPLAGEPPCPPDATVPGAVRNLRITPTNRGASIAFDPPASDGGSAITSYTGVLTAPTGGATQAPSSPITFAGLVNGTTYTFRITAANAVGSGPDVTGTFTPQGPVVTTTTTSTTSTTTTTITPTTTTANPTPSTPSSMTPPTTRPGGVTNVANDTPRGYWMLQDVGRVYGFGAAPGNTTADSASVAIAPSSGDGYWLLRSDGVVVPRNGASHFGNVAMNTMLVGERVATISGRSDGTGYWVFTDRGRAIGFGSARTFGDMTGTPLNGSIVASVATPSGLGYWMIGSDGGVFSFGDAAFAGSMGGRRINAPVVGIVPDPDGVGYWLVAADGGIFAFSADFRGSVPGALAPGVRLNRPVIGAVGYGSGYLMVASDGGIFDFSGASGFYGSLGSTPPSSPIVGVAPLR
jgi:hypothetical protein